LVAEAEKGELADELEEVNTEEVMETEGKDANGDPVVDDDLAIYNMDTYDTEETSQATIFSTVKGLSFYQPDETDPYITLDEEDEEREEMEIQPTDNLILAAKTEDEVSYLEVYVYEEDNMYVHHDIMLPSFPLCLEWLDYPLGPKSEGETSGNFVAVGTFDPHVEIWDLDVIDPAFPVAILGQIPDANLALPQKGKSGPARVAKRIQADRHIDAIMSISWNTVQRNLIATGSADTTIKLWDITRPEKAVAQYTHHTNKVAQVQWNKSQPTVLLSGGYDQKACVFDTRDPKSVLTFNLTADVEVMQWVNLS
jgi:periodic tryptophan protein 1